MKRLLAALLLLPCLAYADITGKVVGITDGDTITVLTPEHQTYKVRLLGIDAPEKGQAFGQTSKKQLSDAIFQREVTVEQLKKIRNERYAGKVFVEGLDISHLMLLYGYAWNYKEYQKGLTLDERQSYEKAERSAKQDKVGLWSDPNPVPPWEYRKSKRR